MNLELIIESTAIVVTTSQIEILTKHHHNDNSNTNTNTSTTTDDDDNDYAISIPHVQLTISHGNIFHPYSKLTIIVPPSKEEKSSRNNRYKLKIGEHNIFEEECHYIFEVSSFSFQRNHNDNHNDDDGDDDDNLKVPTNIIGSYNQFAPKSYVYTNCNIGNGNLFQSFCHLYLTLSLEENRNNDVHDDANVTTDADTNDNIIMMIGNGNVFNSFVTLTLVGILTSSPAPVLNKLYFSCVNLFNI